jgi:hypothetical protein
MRKFSWLPWLSLTAFIAFIVSQNAFAQLFDLTRPGDPIIGVAATPGSLMSSISVVGTVAGANNFPAAESPTNAIDNNSATKYLNFAKINAGFILTLSPDRASFPILGFRFRTANDAPERDPFTITIEGVNAANPTAAASGPTTWTLLYNGVSGLATDPGRFGFGVEQDFSNTLSFNTYRVLITGVRNAAAANSFQFSEIELMAVPEPSVLALVPLAAGVLVLRHRISRKK